MRLQIADDVNEAYRTGIQLLMSEGASVESSRAGEVRVWPEPVVTLTTRPERCVLLDRKRRANPFFHAYEALWMLCGHQDSTMLDRFVSDFSERFGESDGRQHGAYGWRWRNHWSIDQIAIAIERLRRDPRDRRVVIAMWDPMVDASFPQAEHQPRDVPCNTHIYPRIVGGALSLTICCRSNDAMWGAHGANAVHFSFLQQYMAARLEVLVGPMYQLSNNYHVYTDVVRELDPESPEVEWERMLPTVQPGTAAQFMLDASKIVEDPMLEQLSVSDTWISGVAAPMFRCHAAWRERDREIYDMNAAAIQCPVWRQAVQQWWQE